MASKVICVDLWYNSSLEEQGIATPCQSLLSKLIPSPKAFCRIFRIGQKEETTIARLIVKDSADTKLVHMQVQKETIIQQAMTNTRLFAKMTTPELMAMFGTVAQDENQRHYISSEANETVERILRD